MNKDCNRLHRNVRGEPRLRVVQTSREIRRVAAQNPRGIPSSAKYDSADTSDTVPLILEDTTTKLIRTMTRDRSSTPISQDAPPRSPVPVDTDSLEAKLTELSGQFELLKSQVRQAQQLAGLGTATATIAHEVNNLLTPILSYAEYAETSDDVALMKKAISVTAKNTRILVRMSERILELSSATPPTHEAVCLRTVVDDALDSLCRDFSKDGVEATIDVDASIMVWGDHLQFQQVLFNLFLNAREAMVAQHGGRLVVSAGQEADAVLLTINNTGPSIPADVLPTIFDMLRTTKPTERDGRKRCGGLGLALCKDLVTENGGTISATSDQEHGTTFTLRLRSPKE